MDLFGPTISPRLGFAGALIVVARPYKHPIPSLFVYNHSNFIPSVPAPARHQIQVLFALLAYRYQMTWNR